MKIFLTYASEDRDAAERIYLALAGQHHTVFFDRTSLPPGVDYNGRIRQAILESDLLVFLVSDDSVASSSYALTELALAQKKWPHPAGAVFPVMVRVTDYERIPNYLKAVTILQPRGDPAADVAHEIASVADARRPPARIVRALSRHWQALAAVVAAALVVAFAALGGGHRNSDRSSDETTRQLDEMRTTLQAMAAQSATIKAEYERLTLLMSRLQPEQREQLSAGLETDLRASPFVMDSDLSQVLAIMDDPRLSSEEKGTRLVGALTSLAELDRAIDRQAQLVRDQPSGASVDVDTMKLKRLVDKRSQVFDMLRQIIDRYNQTAKGIIDSIGR